MGKYEDSQIDKELVRCVKIEEANQVLIEALEKIVAHDIVGVDESVIKIARVALENVRSEK